MFRLLVLFCSYGYCILSNINRIYPKECFYKKTAWFDVKRTVNWQTINIKSGGSRKWGKSSCLTKLNSRSMKLMQYPVSHSPSCPRSSTILKKNVGVEGPHNHRIVWSRGGSFQGGREHREEWKQDSCCCGGRELLCTCPHAHLLPALILFFFSFFINDTTVHVGASCLNWKCEFGSCIYADTVYSSYCDMWYSYLFLYNLSKLGQFKKV